MKLLKELSENIEYLKEEKDGKTTLYLRGPFMQAECANRNKRIYRLPILEREVNRYLDENVKLNRGFGELGHPSGPNINLDRVAILVNELTRDGNTFVGKAKVTSTPMGQICSGLINDGARLGVSSRALGSLKPLKDEINEVQDDLKLLAIDVVADPSGPECYVDGLFEGREWIFNPELGQWTEQVVNKQVKELKTVKRIDENAKLQWFKSFLSSIKYK